MSNEKPHIYTGIRSRQKMLDILKKEPNAIFLGSYGQEIPHESIYGDGSDNENTAENSSENSEDKA